MFSVKQNAHLGLKKRAIALIGLNLQKAARHRTLSPIGLREPTVYRDAFYRFTRFKLQA